MKTSRIVFVVLFLATASLGMAAQSAKSLWMTNCSECHGKDGRGRTKEGKRIKIADLTNRQVQASFTDEQAFRIIKVGLRDDDGPVMHQTSYRLSDEEVKLLVKHVRSLASKR